MSVVFMGYACYACCWCGGWLGPYHPAWWLGWVDVPPPAVAGSSDPTSLGPADTALAAADTTNEHNNGDGCCISRCLVQ